MADSIVIALITAGFPTITTANLKNRLVTGDYSKLALNAGDNKIYFTGIVTKYEISKYSRWL